ncbi:hypothetical protein [Escherichia phage BEK6]|nr:hypothetical protein [Escherichia phage BEK6]
MKKLTSNTKYEIIDGEAIIYARAKGSNKLTAAFKCHPATIDLIKEYGFKSAINKSLLCKA